MPSLAFLVPFSVGHKRLDVVIVVPHVDGLVRRRTAPFQILIRSRLGFVVREMVQSRLWCGGLLALLSPPRGPDDGARGHVEVGL